ncbi:MAG: RHS repeat protein, partial [Candidatus Omnitrophica bacterium]|nr:RHS repeat protein [Candidatus Omnitrophota bacterium]
MVAPAIAGTVTYDYDNAGRLVKADYGEGTAIEYSYDNAGNLLERKITGEGPVPFFDTGPGTYPSISGMHNGTITPNQTITVSKLYTYPCSGTGGHSEHVRIRNDTWAGIEASWTGYRGDWHNISFPESFT